MAKVGRPPKWSNPKDLQARIDDYFKVVKEENDTHPTITGLVLHCGFADRISFYEYEQKPEFTNTIKTARTRIENIYESHIMKGGAGPIFALKNFGWKDKQEIDIDGKIEAKHEDLSKLTDKELLTLKTLRDKIT